MKDDMVLTLFESIARLGIEAAKDVRLESRDYYGEQNTMGSVARRRTRDNGLTLNVFACVEGDDQSEEDTDAAE